eukprot:5780190-Amphidinium_carterae.1
MERGSAVGTAGVRSVDDEANSGEYIGEENHRVYRSVRGDCSSHLRGDQIYYSHSRNLAGV